MSLALTSLLLLFPLSLSLIPMIRRELVYLNHFNWPFGSLQTPEKFGLAPGKTRNLRIKTEDGEELGAWHLLPHSVYHDTFQAGFPAVNTPSNEVFEESLTRRPTVLFFHGNKAFDFCLYRQAANRAVPYRIRIYTALAEKLDSNVLVIDYRGFGDSTGRPSEIGLIKDAQAIYDYAVNTIDKLGGYKGKTRDAERGTEDGSDGKETKEKEKEIILVGHSLGTGVISQLVSKLSFEGQASRIKAVALIAPFTSISDIVFDYLTFSFLSFIRPPQGLKWLKYLLRRLLRGHNFDALSAMKSIDPEIPVLLLHSKNDKTIPSHHSESLFQGLLSSRETTTSSRVENPACGIKVLEYEKWGTIKSSRAETSFEVTKWEGLIGGHNDLTWTEGTMDLIGRISRIR